MKKLLAFSVSALALTSMSLSADTHAKSTLNPAEEVEAQVEVIEIVSDGEGQGAAAAAVVLESVGTLVDDIKKAGGAVHIEVATGDTHQVLMQDEQRGDDRRGRRGGRSFTPEQIEQFKKRMQERRAQMERQRNEALQKSLNAPADEFALIKSKIEKLENLKRQARPIRTSTSTRGGRDFRRMFEDMQPKGDQTYAKKIKAASDALSAAVKNKAASDETIGAKITALRNARKELDKAITAAKEDLRGILTSKQEATLILRNVLD